MADGPNRLVGRARELETIRRTLDAATAHRGRGLFILGEPGVGKSRLLEETATIARERGMTVLWGRCFEAGGAPSFWPWLQVLRGVLRQLPGADARIGRYRRRLMARLLPELEASTVPADGDDLFGLLDAVVSWLCEVSSDSPLLIGLEDVHAADLASLALLDHLIRQVRSAAISLVVTARDADVDPETAAAFRRTVRDATVLRPPPLDRAAVAAYLEAALGRIDEGLLDAVFAATEGNALFVVEVARWVAVAGPDADPRTVVPPTVRATIAERLDRLPPDTRAVLAHGALLGREFEPRVAAGVFDLVEVDAALQTATAAALGYPTANAWRFSHAVVRDVLAQSWSTSEAERRHRVYAEWLSERPDVSWAEVAYHFGRAGPACRGDARQAFLRSAERALAKHAYEDALRYAAAADESIAPTARGLILAGLAHIGAGRPSAGLEACKAAFDRATEDADAAAMADAALAYGSVYRFGEIDPLLVDMLERARQALSESQVSLHAKVSARLAAARQPAEDPNVPIELARRAIAEAEAAGEDFDRLFTFRAGCSALVDVAPAPLRRPLNARHLALAARLGSSLDVLTARLRLAFDATELGDLDEARDHLEHVIRLCDSDEVPPAVRWRAAAARALTALWSRDLEGAAEAIETSRGRGRAAGDANADGAWLFQTAQLMRLRGAARDLLSLEPHFEELWRGSATGRILARVFWAEALIDAGARDRAAAAAPVDVARRALQLHDRTTLLPLAKVAVLHEDGALVGRIAEVVERDRVAFLHTGVAGMTWIGPASVIHDIAAGIDERPLVRPDAASARDSSVMAAALEGDVWRLEMTGRTIRVKTSKGLRMLVHLLERPGIDVLALDLAHVDQPGGAAVDAGDAGPLIDATARDAYRRRANELKADLEEAEAANDLGRAKRARAELEALTDTLLASTGLGGRSRRVAGAEERARQSATKRLREAIERVRALEPTFGRHLERAVRTGRICRYDP